jgi:hypothetical protein
MMKANNLKTSDPLLNRISLLADATKPPRRCTAAPPPMVQQSRPPKQKEGKEIPSARSVTYHLTVPVFLASSAINSEVDWKVLLDAPGTKAEDRPRRAERKHARKMMDFMVNEFGLCWSCNRSYAENRKITILLQK